MLDYFGIGILFYIAITGIIGYLNRDKYFRTPMRALFYLLLFFVLSDTLGWVLRSLDFTTNWLYNISILVQIPVYLNIYRKLISKEKTKQTFLNFIIGFIIFGVVSLFLFGFHNRFNTFNFFLGGILLTVGIIIFFSHVLKTDKIVNITSYLWFWMSLGLFVFYVGSMPVFTAVNIKFDTNFDSVEILIYILNYIMYSLFITGFLCSRKKLNSSLL